MSNVTKIAFIGPGIMAEAMLRGLIQRAGVAPSQLMLSGPNHGRLDELQRGYGVLVGTDNRAAVEGRDVVVLSVKPQSLPAVLGELSGAIPSSALVLSIVAGARIAAIAEALSHQSVVRAMPNTPAQVGEGITVWTASRAVEPEQIDQTRHILGAFGKEIHVDDEDYLDMATALSGTGPAYTPDSTSLNQSKKSIFIKAPHSM